MKRLIRSMVRKLGFDVIRYRPIGRDPQEDMKKFLRVDRPLIFDIGANIGQTISLFRSQFPASTIHSFEPSPTTFATLQKQASGLPDVHLWNCALGSASGKMTFLENEHPDMSSFLPLSKFGWGQVTKETQVEVKTIDQVCREENIAQIDILKSDTQGYELEVFKGAERMFRENRIKLVYYEIIFSDMYKGLPSFGQTYDFLASRDFLLVSLYRFAYQNQLASWNDALFVHKSWVGENNPAG